MDTLDRVADTLGHEWTLVDGYKTPQFPKLDTFVSFSETNWTPWTPLDTPPCPGVSGLEAPKQGCDRKVFQGVICSETS